MKNLIRVPPDTIISRIFYIHGKKVMFDSDLAKLYEVATKNLNKAVNRNKDRFPSDFCFRLNDLEVSNLRFQFGTSSYGGSRYRPYVFTEEGVAMLSSVLKSKKAVQVNIQIIRTFKKLREILSENKKLAEKIEKMEAKYDSEISSIFQVIRSLVTEKEKPKIEMGFRLE